MKIFIKTISSIVLIFLSLLIQIYFNNTSTFETGFNLIAVVEICRTIILVALIIPFHRIQNFYYKIFPAVISLLKNRNRVIIINSISIIVYAAIFRFIYLIEKITIVYLRQKNNYTVSIVNMIIDILVLCCFLQIIVLLNNYIPNSFSLLTGISLYVFLELCGYYCFDQFCFSTNLKLIELYRLLLIANPVNFEDVRKIYSIGLTPICCLLLVLCMNLFILFIQFLSFKKTDIINKED